MWAVSSSSVALPIFLEERQRCSQKASNGQPCKVKRLPPKTKFSYSITAESMSSSPCFDVPMICPLCSKTKPAVWRYFLKIHFQEKHQNTPQWVRLCSIREKLQVTHSPKFQYHLHCISLEIVPRNWVCEACEASGTSRGTKRSRG